MPQLFTTSNRVSDDWNGFVGSEGLEDPFRPNSFHCCCRQLSTQSGIQPAARAGDKINLHMNWELRTFCTSCWLFFVSSPCLHRFAIGLLFGLWIRAHTHVLLPSLPLAFADIPYQQSVNGLFLVAFLAGFRNLHLAFLDQHFYTPWSRQKKKAKRTTPK